jgi:CheY-like chemotaxis protein
MGHNTIVSNGKIGVAIKRRRKELLWSLEKLGEMIQVSGQQIQRYECGANCLTVDKLQQIAHALSVPICHFFHDADSKKKTFQNDCHEFYTNYRNLHNNEMKTIVTDIVRNAARSEHEREVPALRLGHYYKNNPILLIDDDERALDITKLFLEYEGYRNLHMIQDSRNVIAFLEKNEVALVLLDIRMPHLAGNDLLNTLKNDYPMLPVIVLTANNEIKIKEECMELGALDFLVKPVLPEALMSAIQNAMIN